MTVVTKLDGPRFEPEGRITRQLVVLLHGYGADGNDLFGLHEAWTEKLPDATFIAPNAPQRCDLNPFGYQWFPLDPNMLSAASILQGANAARAGLDAFLTAELERYALPPDALSLVGFSQGAMLALFTGLQQAPGPSAIAAFSGALPDAEGFGAQIKCQPDILLAHGEEDPIVPFVAMGQAERALRAAGLSVTALPAPGLGHGISESAIAETGGFLAQSYAAAVGGED